MKNWQESHYLAAYKLAKSGMPDSRIATALGVSLRVFQGWLKKKPALVQALEDGRGKTGKSEFKDYVYGRLPKSLRELWDKIVEIEESSPDDHEEAVEKLFEGRGVRARQQLYLYAVAHGNFNASEARRKTNVSYSRYRHWLDNDPEFKKLIEGLHEVKKDFFEGSLIQMVAKGDAACTIFANKTINRDRGYEERGNLNVTVDKTVTHRHEVDVLSIELRRKLLEEIEQREMGKLMDRSGEKESEAIDAEFEEKE